MNLDVTPQQMLVRVLPKKINKKIKKKYLILIRLGTFKFGQVDSEEKITVRMSAAKLLLVIYRVAVGFFFFLL